MSEADPEREMELARLSQGSKEAQGRADEPRRTRRPTTDATRAGNPPRFPGTLGGPLPSLVRSLQGWERATLSERVSVD